MASDVQQTTRDDAGRVEAKPVASRARSRRSPGRPWIYDDGPGFAAEMNDRGWEIQLLYAAPPSPELAAADVVAAPGGEADARDAETGWDLYYNGAPTDIKRKLSLHDFKRLGNLFKAAFPERLNNAGGEA